MKSRTRFNDFSIDSFRDGTLGEMPGHGRSGLGLGLDNRTVIEMLVRFSFF